MNFKVFIPLLATLAFGNSFIIPEGKEEVGFAFAINATYQIDDASIFTICLDNINQQRANNGKSPVTSHQQVQDAAYNHNSRMMRNNCFSHQCPGEAGLGDRLSATGYRWGGVGEIIAVGQANCATVVQAWMNSSGHRAIILGDYRHVGCSELTCSSCPNAGPWWTCVFASPL